MERRESNIRLQVTSPEMADFTDKSVEESKVEAIEMLKTTKNFIVICVGRDGVSWQSAISCTSVPYALKIMNKIGKQLIRNVGKSGDIKLMLEIASVLMEKPEEDDK